MAKACTRRNAGKALINDSNILISIVVVFCAFTPALAKTPILIKAYMPIQALVFISILAYTSTLAFIPISASNSASTSASSLLGRYTDKNL